MTEIVFGYRILLDWYKELVSEFPDIQTEADNNWREMTEEGCAFYCSTIKLLDTTGSLNILQINQILTELSEEITNTLNKFNDKYKPFLPKNIILLPQIYFLTWE